MVFLLLVDVYSHESMQHQDVRVVRDVFVKFDGFVCLSQIVAIQRNAGRLVAIHAQERLRRPCQSAAVDPGVSGLPEPDQTVRGVRSTLRIEARDLDVGHVVADQRGTMVVVGKGQVDVAKSDVSDMSNEEAVGGKRSEHSTTWIRIRAFRDLSRSVFQRAAALELDADVVQGHILDRMARQSGDRATDNALARSFDPITDPRGLDVADLDVTQRAYAGVVFAVWPSSISQTDEKLRHSTKWIGWARTLGNSVEMSPCPSMMPRPTTAMFFAFSA